MTSQPVELSVLGPLEARRGATRLELGGAKQRIVLTTLLLGAGEVVSMDALADEVWEDEPPPSAVHSLEAYVSRLRHLFDPRELTLARSGAGYVLRLGSAVLDATELERLAADAECAARDGDADHAAAAATAALALWRAPALTDAGSGPIGRGEAARIEHLCVRMLEVRFDAELELGRHVEVVGELQAAVARHPYRERLVGQLMLALYRCGRQTDALAVYEETRRRLDDELGLRPSTELQQLSARIVRHEAELQAPPASRPAPRERRARRVTGLVAVGIVATAAMALSANGSAPTSPAGPSGRVAVVLPADPTASAFDASTANSRMAWTAAGFRSGAADHRLTADTLTVDESDPSPATVERLLRRIETGGFDLVVLPGDRASARLVAPHVARHPATRFVFMDASLADLSLEGVPNAVAVRFAFEYPAQMAGAAGGLVLEHTVPPARGARFAVVAGVPSLETRRVIEGFRKGVHGVLPGARIRVDYAGETSDVTPCEELANRQIDAGAEVVLVVAGRCGMGAAAVVRSRGAWLAGEDEYGVSDDQPWVVASMFKDWDDATRQVVQSFVAGTLPTGDDLEMGLHDLYATGMTMSDAVPQDVQSEVIELCTRIRQQAARAAAA